MSCAVRKLFLVATLLVSSPVCADAEAPKSDQQPVQPKAMQTLNRTQYQVVEDTNTAATMSVEELKQGVLASLEKIDSVAVDFRFNWVFLIDGEVDRAEKQAGQVVKRNQSRVCRFAMKGEQRLAIRSDLLRRPLIDHANNLIAVQSIVMHWDGRRMKQFNSLGNSGSISDTKPGYIEDVKSPYFTFIGFNYQSRGQDRFLRSQAHYRVLPNLQTVDGFACHVVSCGWDILWIDQQHGFCLRRRASFAGHDLNQAQPQQLRYCKDFTEAAPGIWWPKQCCAMTYLDTFDASADGDDIHDIWYVTVDKLQINNVPDETFKYNFPAGTLVADSTINKAYYMPEKPALVSEAIKLGVPIKNGIVSSKPGVLRPAP